MQQRWVLIEQVEVEDLRLEEDELLSESEGRGSETLDEYLNRFERQAILEGITKTGETGRRQLGNSGLHSLNADYRLGV